MTSRTQYRCVFPKVFLLWRITGDISSAWFMESSFCQNKCLGSAQKAGMHFEMAFTVMRNFIRRQSTSTPRYISGSFPWQPFGLWVTHNFIFRYKFCAHELMWMAQHKYALRVLMKAFILADVQPIPRISLGYGNLSDNEFKMKTDFRMKSEIRKLFSSAFCFHFFSCDARTASTSISPVVFNSFNTIIIIACNAGEEER